MTAIVTVVGKDRVGIIAEVCVKLAEYNYGGNCYVTERSFVVPSGLP